jgi:hypothetical protein
MTARSRGPLRQFSDGVRAPFPRTPAQFAATFLTQALLQHLTGVVPLLAYGTASNQEVLP